MRVLVADKLSQAGLQVFEEAEDVEVDIRTGLSEAELCEIIGEYEGLVVRSATKATPKLLEHAENLRVIGRAGIGVDHIDLLESSRRGIVVMNAPFGNAVTTAEHALSLLMSLARHVPRANRSMQAGRWDKSKLRGTELWNKTMGVLGWGNIGSIVADRANGLRMKVLACDPTKTPEEAQAANVTLVDFDTLLAESDFISVHVPLRPSTRHLFDAAAFKAMKNTALLVNAARGGIVNESALADALRSGEIAGAALDVFEQEPLEAESPLRAEAIADRISLTPHLGASTLEAQVRVGVQIAEQVVAFLRTGNITHGVNTPTLDEAARQRLADEVQLASKLGRLAAQLGHRESGSATELRVHATGELSDLVTSLGQHVTAAYLTERGLSATPMSARYEAKGQGIRLTEMTTPESTTGLRLELVVGDSTLALQGHRDVQGGARLTGIDDYGLDVPLTGHALIVWNDDKPGVIGSVGTVLGQHGVNVARLQVALDEAKGRALAYWSIDGAADVSVQEKLAALPHVRAVHLLTL